MQLLLTYDIDSEISLVRAVSIGAFAAVVDKPVAVARADRGPARGISGEPYEVIGFAI